jgi:hypothetical protein
MPVSGGHRKQILNVSASKLSHPLTCRFFLVVIAFGHKVCEPEGRAFSDETTFSPSLSDHAVGLISATLSAAGKIGCRADLRLSGRLLEEGHYTHQQLNAEMSQKFLRNYLELLDFSHLFFTQKDVDALTAKYGTALADDVLLGNLKPAYEIYDLYQKRVDERVGKIKELLKQPMDFKSDATVELRREKAPWPKDEAEADQLWKAIE